MILGILTLTGLFCAVAVAFARPKIVGWATVAIVPLIGTTQFTLVPSDLLPLTAYRLAFAVSIGILLRASYRRSLARPLLRSGFVRVLIMFTAYLVFISSPDRLSNIVFSYLPELFLSVTIGYVLVRDERDLNRLISIFCWHGAVIGFLVIIEFTTQISTYRLLSSTNPHQNLLSLQSLTRAGFFRPQGLDGNSVQSAYRLVFLAPFALWYAVDRGRGAKRFVPVTGVIIALALLQTRAAWVALFVGLAALPFSLTLASRASLLAKLKTLAAPLLSGAVALTLIAVAFPTTQEVFVTSLSETLAPLLQGDLRLVDAKLSRIPVALELIARRPLTGYGSPQFVYYELMQTDDLPSLLIYVLSGGLILGLLFLALLASMVGGMLRHVHERALSQSQRIFAAFALSGFLAGTVVVFSNWQERHFLEMYLVYMAIYRVYAGSATRIASAGGGNITTTPGITDAVKVN
jgi:O-Antigen ligase